MTRQQFQAVRQRFADYTATFAAAEHSLPPMLQLKKDHSERVAGEALALAQALGWAPGEKIVAKALGLLHDVGRFSQYADFGTFSDAASVDHGERGWEVVCREGWLHGLAAPAAERIAFGIRYHNRRALPDNIPATVMPWVACIRDADKVDIYNVVLEAVDRDGFRDLPDMLPGVTLDRRVSEAMLDNASQCAGGALACVRTLGDFLVLQMTWVYDINYAPTLARMRERGVIPRLLAHVESTPAVRRLAQDIEEYVRNRGG